MMIKETFLILFIVLFKNYLFGFESNINLFEGDILGIPVGGNRTKRGAVGKNTIRWPNGFVPYTFDIDFNATHKDMIKAALKEISDDTDNCIKFILRTNEVDYVKITNGNGCSSHVGKQNGMQILNLEIPSCVTKGVVIHEFLHALGMWHEHTRPDRDEYIIIILENIMTGLKFIFDKHSVKNINISQPYDYESIMHYNSKAFSKNRLDTIKPIKSGVILHEKTYMSIIDINELRSMYKCPLLNCQDVNSDCEYLARIGDCTKNPNYMLSSCCKSCRNERLCQDENSKCGYWASIGECTKNPNYMFSGCCKSCKTVRLCEDKYSKCEYLASIGECSVKPIYMLSKCCKSCRNERLCQDENSNCEYWASIGECTKNPNYMLSSCCKACRNTSTNSTRTAPSSTTRTTS